MKKLLFVTAILIGGFFMAQTQKTKEFARLYSHFVSVKEGEGASDVVRFPSKVIYNYGNEAYVQVTVRNSTYLYEIIGKKTKGSDDTFGAYESHQALDQNEDLYIISVFADAVLIFNSRTNNSVFFFNK